MTRAHSSVGWLVLFTGLAALAMLGCSVIWVPGYKVLPLQANEPHGPRWIAGAKKIEITPPPGYPTGGHGPAGTTSRGYWTRLWVRAFYLNDNQGHQVAFVSCDVFAVPAALTSLVARALRSDGFAPEELVIAATHTHQGPGNYLSASIYNQFGSDHEGFDRELLNALARQITAAVTAARKDAFDHGNDIATIAIRRGDTLTEMRNRAPRVFLLNWNRDKLMDEFHQPPCNCARRPDEPTDGWDLSGCPRLRAFDPQLTLMEIRRGPEAIGLMVFFAAHPTVLRHNAPLFSSDFVGVAMLALERTAGYQVAGFFNGAEGDVTARRETRDLGETRRFGLNLRDDVVRILSKPPAYIPPSITVASDARGVESACVDSRPGGHAEYDPSLKLASLPEFGVAALGGAEDDRTVLYDLGWREGVRGVPERGQGPKQPGLDSKLLPIIHLTGFFAPRWAFPHTLPTSLIRLGQEVVATVPSEFTTAAGRDLREQVAAATGVAMSDVLLVGLANEYISYTTTAAEYTAQDYSGASVIWGPTEAAFLSCRLANLATAVPRTSFANTRLFFPGTPKHFGPADCGEPHRFPDEELEEILLDPTGRPARQIAWFEWTEDSRSVTDQDAPFRRSVMVLESVNGGWQPRATDLGVDDDMGIGLLTLLLDGKSSCRRWAAIWISPLWEVAGGTYSLHVRGADGVEHCSVGFTVAEIEARGPHALADIRPCKPIVSLRGLPESQSTRGSGYDGRSNIER